MTHSHMPWVPRRITLLQKLLPGSERKRGFSQHEDPDGSSLDHRHNWACASVHCYESTKYISKLSQRQTLRNLTSNQLTEHCYMKTNHWINQAYIRVQYKLSNQLWWHETQTPNQFKHHRLATVQSRRAKSCLVMNRTGKQVLPTPGTETNLEQLSYHRSCKKKARFHSGKRYFLMISILTSFSRLCYVKGQLMGMSIKCFRTPSFTVIFTVLAVYELTFP